MAEKAAVSLFPRLSLFPRPAARRHALAAIRFAPLNYDSWSLMYHAVAER